MNRIALITLTALFFGGGVSLAPAQEISPLTGILETVEARVNDDVITTSEVDEILTQVEIELGRPFRTQREFERNRQRVVDRLIKEILLEQEARRRGYTMDESDLNAAIEREWQTRVEAQGGEAAMQKHLAEAGISEEDLRGLIATEVERDYLRTRVINSVLNSTHTITGDDVEQFLVKNPTAAKEAERVRLSYILIAVPEGVSGAEKSAAFQKAERVVNEIRAHGPESFANSAREYSDHEATRARGGDLGVVGRGDFPEPFEIAFDMEPGEVSNPIETDQGYIILKVSDKRTIDDVVRQGKLRGALDDFLEALESNAIIVVKGRRP